MRADSLLPRFSRGATLVEVMVAALVMSIGLMGVAAMHVSALQGANNAQFRSRATDLAISLTDRVRTNNGADASYVSAAGASCETAPVPVCAMVPDAGAASAICTPQQMAVYDLWEIRCQKGVLNGVQSLPGGSLEVTCSDATCSPSSTMQITISWETTNRETESQPQEVALTIIPGEP
jgi:type IV pilus assembly protein PilV